MGLARAVKRPVAMFVDQSDSASIQVAVDAGVSAYIVDGLKKERITSIFDLCISRFNAFARLQCELDRAKDALEERKVIDRAKGVLMKAKSLAEEQAYALLRKTAMNENKKIVEIAQSLLTAAELFEGSQASHRLYPAGRCRGADRRGRYGFCRGRKPRYRADTGGVVVECPR
jgi:two-component system, response regulator / RNA-binding antiterminator